MGIITSILGFLLANPMVILGFLGVFVFSSIGSDIKGWYRERQVIKPWIAAVKERDAASSVKEAIAIQAIESRESSLHEISDLRTQLEAAELERKAKNTTECPWTDDDIRVLNSGRGRKKSPPSN
jgi:hypothetical protein